MKYIQKLTKLFKESVVSAGKFIESNANILALVFSIFAVILGGYNAYQIKNITNGGGYSSTSGAIITSPEKITQEIPKGTPFLGNSKAKLTIVEFGDYQCPYCEQFFKESLPVLKSSYIDTGKVKFVFLDFAFLGQESKDAANAAYCANEQGKFWDYHYELYNNQQGENSGGFNDANLKKFAVNLDINSDGFDKCVQANKYKDLIDKEFQLAQKFGVTGTPTLLIGKNLLKGVSSTANIEQIINSQLK